MNEAIALIEECEQARIKLEVAGPDQLKYARAVGLISSSSVTRTSWSWPTAFSQESAFVLMWSTTSEGSLNGENRSLRSTTHALGDSHINIASVQNGVPLGNPIDWVVSTDSLRCPD